MSNDLGDWIARYKAKVRAKEQEKLATKRRRAAERIKRHRAKCERERLESLAVKTKTPQSECEVESRKLLAVTLTPQQVAEVGQHVAGSALVRDFCCVCGEAMRVINPSVCNICLDCEPTGVPGKRHGRLEASGIEYHGGRFNAGEW